jgi:8-oxo-dGTP pyrophosphatase MutT (NUDIX family)
VFTIRRQVARVALLEPEGRVLMIQARDPGNVAAGHHWHLPGGGLDPHEEAVDAIRRELLEETGIAAVDVGPCVVTQHVRFTFGGMQFEQDERIHVAWTDAAHEVRPHGLEALEVVAFLGTRWWHAHDVAGTDEVIYPPRLAEVLDDLCAGRVPAAPLDWGGRPDDGGLSRR